ncbi:hypothetical protein [Dyadobacter sp. 32]|uniref:lipopolysaccharide biosynthesis protein n=1 Tax=Dyadobacter sp. 32 TaxID=538966 RepID=UPI0011EBA816
MTIKENLIKNGLATGVGKLIRIAEQLFLVPFFISAWGGEYYGEWLTLTIIPSFLAFSDFGFGTSAANIFLLKYTSGDEQGAANIAKSGTLMITIVVLFSIFLSLSIIIGLDKYGVFDKSLIKRSDAILAISLMIIAKIINFYNQFFESYFRCARKAAFSINLQTVYSAANMLLGLTVLLIGKGVVHYALINLAVSLIFNPIYIWKARQILPIHNRYKGVIIKSELKEIANKGFGYLLSPVWQAIYFQGTTFVVRLTLGPLAVAVFNTTRTLVRAVNQVFNMVTLSVFPEFQFQIGSGNMESARQIFRLTFTIVIVAALAGIIFLYFFGPWLYGVWTHKTLDPPAGMWNVFLVGIALNAVWWTSTITFQALNKPYYFTVLGTISAIISVGATYFLSQSHGLLGTALGSILLDLILALSILPMSCKLLDQPIKEIFSNLNLKLKPAK